MSATAVAQVRAVVESVIALAGVDLEDVLVHRVGPRQLVQVLVDQDGGVDLDTVARVSRLCSDALDNVQVFGGAYDLEVSSPGVDRPLIEPRHWRRNTGRLVQARLRDGKDVTGRIVRTDTAGFTLSVGAKERTIAYADAARGIVQLEFKHVDNDPDSDDPGNNDKEAAR